MLSIIIPSYKEPYLDRTIKDITDKATGEVEVIPILDMGMRDAINEGLNKAKGEYIMKVDAHCCFAKGFDEVLTKDCEENWLVVPRRYSLHADNWDKDERMPVKDYHFLSYPAQTRSYGTCIWPVEWTERTKERMNFEIDDTMSLQGSCYVANRKYFMEHIYPLDVENYTNFAAEHIEVGLKYWLKGGEIKVNKKTWYAHLFKNKKYYQDKETERNYKIGIKIRGGYKYACEHWLKNEEPGQIHEFSWLVDKFWPVPTWPEDRSLWIYPN